MLHWESPNKSIFSDLQGKSCYKIYKPSVSTALSTSRGAITFITSVNLSMASAPAQSLLEAL